MIALLQRVTRAHVEVNGETVGAVGTGLLALAGIEREDIIADAERLAQRVVQYRLFEDEQGRMNQSVVDVDGGILLVPQFTLAADTDKGNRPGFGRAAPPAQARELFQALTVAVGRRCHRVQTGRFGAHMQVVLVNDGPVTFWLSTRRSSCAGA